MNAYITIETDGKPNTAKRFDKVDAAHIAAREELAKGAARVLVANTYNPVMAIYTPGNVSMFNPRNLLVTERE